MAEGNNEARISRIAYAQSLGRDLMYCLFCGKDKRCHDSRRSRDNPHRSWKLYRKTRWATTKGVR